MRTAALLITLVAPLFLCGCYITGMALENRTGKTIEVYSHHTKTSVIIPDTSMKEVSHSAGPITVSVHDGPTWDYDDFSWFSGECLSKDYLKRHPILRKGTRGFLIDANGSIFILRKALIGWDHKDYAETQPRGYPLRPGGRR